MQIVDKKGWEEKKIEWRQVEAICEICDVNNGDCVERLMYA